MCSVGTGSKFQFKGANPGTRCASVFQDGAVTFFEMTRHLYKAAQDSQGLLACT